MHGDGTDFILRESEVKEAALLFFSCWPFAIYCAGVVSGRKSNWQPCYCQLGPTFDVTLCKSKHELITVLSVSYNRPNYDWFKGIEA